MGTQEERFIKLEANALKTGIDDITGFDLATIKSDT